MAGNGKRTLNGPERDLRPLSRGYSREAKVLADIDRLARLSEPEFWRRLEITDFQDLLCPRLESLVYFIRTRLNKEDLDGAWRISQVIVGRIAGTVARRLAAWRTLSPSEREEIENSLNVNLYSEWLSLDPAHEFWEVRFGVCLDRRISDEIERAQRIGLREVQLAPYRTELGHDVDPLEEIVDLSDTDPFDAAVYRAALDRLPEPMRTTFYLHHFEDWSAVEIGRQMRVDERTVRNRLKRARSLLADWWQTE